MRKQNDLNIFTKKIAIISLARPGLLRHWKKSNCQPIQSVLSSFNCVSIQPLQSQRGYQSEWAFIALYPCTQSLLWLSKDILCKIFCFITNRRQCPKAHVWCTNEGRLKVTRTNWNALGHWMKRVTFYTSFPNTFQVSFTRIWNFQIGLE